LTSTPDLLNALLNQSNPLLSIQTFPIAFGEQLWGFVGFDDCRTPRQWDELEIRMLSTASEMIGNTIQRWQAEEQLRETLSHLEVRVQERTIEFAQANAELKHEISVRQRFQNELEERLKIEIPLAGISARLVSPADLQPAIRDTLADLGEFLQASRVFFISLAPLLTEIVGDAVEWHLPGAHPLTNELNLIEQANYAWFRNQLDDSKSIYLKDLSSLPSKAQPESAFLMGQEVDSLLLTPLFMDNRLAGVIACSDPNHQKARTSENIQSVEVVAGMLSSLLQREVLLNTLEEKVAERTRELFAFFDLAILAGETQEISDILQSALVKIMEISASQAAIIHLYDEDQNTLNLVAQRGFSKDFLLHLRTIHLNESLTSWVETIGNGEESESSVITRLPAEFMFPGYFSAYHIPLRARGKLQGLLSCYRLVEFPFDPYQSSFLNAIGEQLGMAVENYRLRLKAEEIATIQERQRLARELHDAVSQSLYSLTLFARSGRDALEVGDQVKLLDSLLQLETNSLSALREMRLLLYQLRSLALEEGGLVEAVESRFNLVERRSGIQATIDKDDRIELTGQIEQELYRLVTEALNNSLKHAGASQVSVTIQADDSLVVLDIRDNGGGFDPDRAYPGMGMQNMRDRVSALCGRFELDSQPGSGTRIHVEIPQLDVPSREA
jgi:signal transduction histidine kinase